MAREALFGERGLQLGKDVLAGREVEGSPPARAKFRVIVFVRYPEPKIEAGANDINSSTYEIVSGAPTVQGFR
jgi:hypothetical protein